MAEQSVRREFDDVVNMTPKELEDWLATDESQAVGWGGDGGESVGHESGRRIVEIKRKKKDDLTDDDLAHMRKVVGYAHRHLAQGRAVRGQGALQVALLAHELGARSAEAVTSGTSAGRKTGPIGERSSGLHD